MRVDELSPSPGSNKAKKRLGRGIGGKGGKTAGAGTKGQHSRGRGKVARGFEGGQMPLKQRVPKLKGFNNPFRVEYSPVNLDQIAAIGESNVDPDVLIAKGYVRKPNVSMIVEMADMREASRSYESNLQAIKQAKEMISTTIDLLRSSA